MENIPKKEYKMATKKVLNVGKIMVLSGAVIILILAAFLCGYFLKETHNKKTPSNIPPVPQTTMMANEVVPATTQEITTTTAQTTISESTTTTTVPVTNALTVRGNGDFQEYVIKLANPSLDIYSEPSYNSMILDVITDRGSYVITKEVVDEEGNKWGLLETDFGWINLIDARKADPNDPTYDINMNNNNNNNDNNDDENNENNNNNNNYNNNTNNNGGNGGLTGIDADGDGWDDGWNPDAWCPYCGYDSYYNADGSLTCSQGHTWSY